MINITVAENQEPYWCRLARHEGRVHTLPRCSIASTSLAQTSTYTHEEQEPRTRGAFNGGGYSTAHREIDSGNDSCIRLAIMTVKKGDGPPLTVLHIASLRNATLSSFVDNHPIAAKPKGKRAWDHGLKT